MTKYIFVTGGVVSGLGKGITAASLGRLLKARGLKVAAQKLDPCSRQAASMRPAYQRVIARPPERRRDRSRPPAPERFIDEDLNKYSNSRPERSTGTFSTASGAANIWRDGAGHPAHHKRDQRLLFTASATRRIPDRRHHRGRRHDRRHREPAVSRAIRQVGGRRGKMYLHPCDARAVSAARREHQSPRSIPVKELQGMGIPRHHRAALRRAARRIHFRKKGPLFLQWLKPTA